ncbi:hypothetical protein [Sphingomonas sp. VNH70]|uniref:hypothetical protein n=1 Tax=Sphingomonas silueang TaxID=3156617 RepID=UPI0032B539DE
MAGVPFVHAPAGYVPAVGLAFGAANSPATAVATDNPLPVSTVPAQHAAASVPLAGVAAATGVVGPFVPQLGRPIWLALSGNWSGSIRLLRGGSAGAVPLPLTYGDGSTRAPWTTNLLSPVAEESVAGAQWFLDITLAAGSVTYRMEQ